MNNLIIIAPLIAVSNYGILWYEITFYFILYRRIFYSLVVNKFNSLVVRAVMICGATSFFTWFQAHLCVSLFNLSYYNFSAGCE